MASFKGVVLRASGLTTLMFVAAGAAWGTTIIELHNGISSNSQPQGICSGPDGNLWFAETQANKIGKMTMSGVFTEFSVITPGSGVRNITAGPDGNLWFTEPHANKIGRITTAGVVTEFSSGITPNTEPFGITAGSDGNLWFTEFFGGIGKITPTGTVSEFTPPTSGNPWGICAGTDGNLWFTEANSRRVCQCSTGGIITEFPLAGTDTNPEEIAAGPDGNVWFCQPFSSQVGKIGPHGTITEYDLPPFSSPSGIVAGAANDLWIAGTTSILRITTSGLSTATAVPTSGNNPTGIAIGKDGNVYFTEQGSLSGVTFVNGQLGRLIPSWEPKFIGKGGDGTVRTLWLNEDGRAYVAKITSGGTVTNGPTYFTFGAVPISFAEADDNTSTILWRNPDGSIVVWFMSTANARTSFVTLPPG